GRPLAAVSYALCLAEIVDQLAVSRLKPAAVYVSAAGATGAGLALGWKVLGLAMPIKLVCPIKWPWKVHEDMAEVAHKTAALLELPHRLQASEIQATEDYVGAGYGQLTPDGVEAMDLLARTEGILLDPSYTAKAMAALIDDVRRGRYKAGEVVVFVH